MKTKDINFRVVISVAFICFGLIIAAVPENTTKPYKLTSQEMLDEIKSGTQFIHPDLIADLLINKDPSLRLIDVRSEQEYDKYHLPGALNIPIDNLLSNDWLDILDQDVFMNVYYSNGNTKANEAWLLTRQLGYENNYVMQGGLNYWAETILNPSEPTTTSPDDEFILYDFRKGAGMSLGGDAVTSQPSGGDTKANKPPMIPKKRKKKVAKGGC